MSDINSINASKIIAEALYSLGTGRAATNMGAVEFLAVEISKAMNNHTASVAHEIRWLGLGEGEGTGALQYVAEGLFAIATSLDRIAEKME